MGYRRHFERYPLIHMTWKGIKAESWEIAWEEIRSKIAALFREHDALLDGGHLDEVEARDYRAVIDGSARRAVPEGALLELSRLLERHHRARTLAEQEQGRLRVCSPSSRA